MRRKIMCEYSNCTETLSGDDYKVIVTMGRKSLGTERETFCCLEHAWRALARYDREINKERK